MQTINDTIRLLRRQADLERAMRKPGGIRITEEQELILLKRRLEQYPAAASAVVQAAHALRKSVSEISAHDVESWANSFSRSAP